MEVARVFDEEIGDFVNEYPNFKESPRITPKGRRWVNVTDCDCPYADANYGDCGSCRYFLCETSGDMIGICTNEEFQHRKDKQP
ncbi:MAG: hypothetical protein E7614_03495 [Ruminococcaceae bacterium]|nr:hypothetical protein [Oscillospiraceae bacterium]